jgi:hypothetical protein
MLELIWAISPANGEKEGSAEMVFSRTPISFASQVPSAYAIA